VLPEDSVTNPVKIAMPTIREYHDEATAHQLDKTIKATLPVQNV
jgi:hypothetical protein